ncbi:hypothetical protein C8A05DRAFT_47165 [Staphylotrichum tortipilum]|uniref:Uncharacterized protein n=1 Tax=Staphylotrichum tortipilum TaxID=2831512 RepID=A0AAN6RPT9_9PEZI|nr:hypothetical protein C8A05DRAFT_47165 [Staphylotrichum longicolle]
MLGKLLLTVDAIGLLLGAPIADYNHTHIFNPRWTPHAKFHGAQTITLSVALGLATLYYTWRSPPSPSIKGHSPPTPQQQSQQQQQAEREFQRDSLNTALLTGTLYWLAGLVAILYPGTDGIDPEFGPSGFPQAPIFVGFAGAAVVGWGVELFLARG